jgi:hypothetical protein
MRTRLPLRPRNLRATLGSKSLSSWVKLYMWPNSAPDLGVNVGTGTLMEPSMCASM